MKLKTIVTEYIDLKQSMGMRFHSMAVILRAFCKAAGDLNIEDVSPVTVSVKGQHIPHPQGQAYSPPMVV